MAEENSNHQSNNDSGFTLLELMIVAAVISILGSIAIPNYLSFSRKARQAEARSNLAMLYTTEKIFFVEWGGYTGDFRDLGLQIGGRLTYDVGFANAGWLPPTLKPASSAYCGPRMAFNTEVSYCALSPGSSQAKVIFKPAVASASCGAALAPTQTAYRATAIANLGGKTPDVWTIDQDKTICNNASGL